MFSLRCLMVFLFVVQLQAQELPRLLTQKAFSCTDLTEAANHYIAMGEQEAIAAWLAASADESVLLRKQLDRVERITWLCRMIYKAKGRDHLRPPSLGGLALPAEIKGKDWPHYPLVADGDTFFVMSEGYNLAGVAEPLQQYIQYCQLHGDFKTKKLRPVSKALAQESLEQIYSFKSWVNINWTTAELKRVQGFMQAQVDAIPEKAALHQSDDIDKIALRYRELRRITDKPVRVNPTLFYRCDRVHARELSELRKENGPHTFSSIHVYMNERAAQAFSTKQNKYPVGAVVIKEKHLYADWSNAVGGMIKRQTGYNPGNGDWEYFYVEDQGTIERGKIESCVQCHKQARNRDYVFGKWAEARP